MAAWGSVAIVGGLGTLLLLLALNANGGLVHALEWVLSWHATVIEVILAWLKVDKAATLGPLWGVAGSLLGSRALRGVSDLCHCCQVLAAPMNKT